MATNGRIGPLLLVNPKRPAARRNHPLPRHVGDEDPRLRLWRPLAVTCWPRSKALSADGYVEVDSSSGAGTAGGRHGRGPLSVHHGQSHVRDGNDAPTVVGHTDVDNNLGSAVSNDSGLGAKN
jgi:hypothetical protein